MESGFDAAAAEMAVEESTDLLSGQAAVGCVDGFQDTVGGVVTGGCAEEERGAGGAVVPHREGSLKVRQPDDGAAVENRVYGAEAQNLGFGATGGGAVEAWITGYLYLGKFPALVMIETTRLKRAMSSTRL